MIDGFAGPGAYEDGTAGSPKLILDFAREVRLANRRYELVPVLVELMQPSYTKLVRLVAEYPDVHRTEMRCADFWGTLTDLAELVRGEPTLLLVDPFGIKGLDLEKLAAFTKATPKCDLVVTFVETAVKRLAGAYPEDVRRALGTGPSVEDPAGTFAANMSAAGGFLKGGRFEIKQNFDASKTYELIVFSHSPDAYRLWNDFMAKEWESLRQKGMRNVTGMFEGFADLQAEAEAKDDLRNAQQEILLWQQRRSNEAFTRPDLLNYFAVHRFAEFHSKTLSHALTELANTGVVRRLRGTPPRIDSDLWETIR